MLRPEERPGPRARAAAKEIEAGRSAPQREEEIRSDISEMLDESIPLIKDKMMEMNHIYAKIDKLELHRYLLEQLHTMFPSWKSKCLKQRRAMPFKKWGCPGHFYRHPP